MTTTRQQKFSRLIQKELSDVFQKEGKNVIGSTFITITQVHCSSDLMVVKVYLSFLIRKNAESIIALLEKYNKEIRKMLAYRIKKQVRAIPELHFYLDSTLEEVEKIEQLLKDAKIPTG